MAHTAEAAATTGSLPVQRSVHATPQVWHQAFRATCDQALTARHYLAAILKGSPLAGDALSCLGELANNAILHSNSRYPGGFFTVRVEIRPRRLRVEVHDNGGHWAPNGSGDDSPTTSGRGLLIVAALAAAWDISPRTSAPSRTAWFEMDLP